VWEVAVDLDDLLLGVLVLLGRVSQGCDLFVIREVVVDLILHDHFLEGVSVGVRWFVIAEDNTGRYLRL
jgi:hypothetical protein